MKFEYEFVNEGTSYEYGGDKIWVDVGNCLSAGVYDHHHDSKYGSCVKTVVGENYGILNDTYERYKNKETICFVTHYHPDIDALYSIYMIKYTLENGIDAFKEEFCTSGNTGYKMVDYVDEIDRGKNKVITRINIYTLISYFEKVYFTKESTDLITQSLKWFDDIHKELGNKSISCFCDFRLGEQETIKYQGIINRQNECYEIDKKTESLAFRDIYVFRKEGDSYIPEVKTAAIWNREPSDYESSYIIAREKGAFLTFVPQPTGEVEGDSSLIPKARNNKCIISLNPDDKDYEEYTLEHLAEFYEELEQIYDFHEKKKKGSYRRDYSKPRGEGNENDTRFSREPFSETADPWYVSVKGDLVATPGIGTGIPVEKLIEVLINHTQIIKEIKIHSLSEEKKESNNKEEKQLHYKDKNDFIWNKQYDLRDVKKITDLEERWKDQLEENRIENTYSLLTVEYDSSLIAYDNEVFDAYYMRLIGMSYMESDNKDFLGLSYREKLYVNENGSVLFYTDAKGNQKNDVNEIIDCVEESLNELYCQKMELLNLSQKLKSTDSNSIINEDVLDECYIQHKNLMIDTQLNSYQDDALSAKIYKYIERQLGLEVLRKGVSDAIEMAYNEQKEINDDRLSDTMSIISFLAVFSALADGYAFIAIFFEGTLHWTALLIPSFCVFVIIALAFKTWRKTFKRIIKRDWRHNKE